MGDVLAKVPIEGLEGDILTAVNRFKASLEDNDEEEGILQNLRDAYLAAALRARDVILALIPEIKSKY